ncbi:DNA-directed DNA polymerase II small subunit [Thermococcus peptonophilus]|uniref:DNA polymerase II small subunit n=1 Tax=Thermococcus peptonophilus TaxID=53952 RepID=A0A142CVA2_9EURY|nr:DNA-directed DNA polymerase II small subunit [Thermococcus peptonophilus]AMQ18704.1 DNA polymerase II [Thermococcus peptonophilus]
MLVEDLLKNNYLITPSAYYLLADHYKKAFTLAELIKFAKNQGTFVIDSNLAREFLAEKGIISSGNGALEGSALSEISVSESHPEPSPEVALESEGSESLEAPLDEGIEDDGESSVASSIAPAEDIVVAEESFSVEDEISTEPDLLTSVEDNAEVVQPSEGEETSISTGNALKFGDYSGSVSELETLNGPFLGGESFISTGTSEGDTLIEEPPEEEFSAENGFPDESLTLENGSENGYGDSEEYYENGDNGVKPKIVYGDYGVPMAYVADETPEEEKAYSTYSDLVITPKEGFNYRAKEIPDEWELAFDVKNVKFEVPKVKNAQSKEGEVIIQVYSSYFKSRLKKMRRIFRENPEIGTIVDIAKLSYVREKDVTIIGLVNEKRETKKGYLFEIEDATGRIKVFISSDKEGAKEAYNTIMPDSVVAFRGTPGKGIFFANRVFLPDVPKFKRSKPPLEEKVYAILLSDIHVGSNKFCEEAFIKFLEWLNGEVNSRTEEELVSRIKYIIIGGDVVDGVGIYPGQYNELAIPDIFDQYEALANLLKQVPDHITMFIGPGNHDAARTALPQPGFYEEYAKPLYKLKNAVIISNPAVIRLHGRDFLIAHGRGIEDVVDFVPNRSHHRPAEAMIELLKLRHIAPTFGNKVPIAPDPEDTLVIESVPDLFQAGHVHVMQYKIYNGVFVINTGTWQAQTEFQKMVNIIPTPARVPIIDVETSRVRAVVRFDQFCEGV